MKNVVINAYVRENAGDAALLAVRLRHIREADAVSRADPVVPTGGGYLPARPGPDGHQNVFDLLREVGGSRPAGRELARAAA